MNIKSTDSVYPSYKDIQQTIQEQYLKKYQRKINALQDHLRDLESQHHFEKDHLKIQNSILTLATQNPPSDIPERGTLKARHQKKGSCLSSYHGESLNYYIEDDGEEESNYETYLKFKKKTLERDLEQETISKRGLNRRQKEEEELFFRKLYGSQELTEAKAKKGPRSLKGTRITTKQAGFNYQGLKENAGKFLKKVQKRNIKLSDRNQLEGNETTKEKGKESQMATYQQNRKLLTENYLTILKKLESTNIVKWRVLNTDIVPS